MSEDFVDQMIAEANPEPQEQPDQTANEVVTEEPKTETEAQPVEVEDVPFPKKAINALSRRDKQIGKLRAEIAQRDSELAAFRQSQQQKAEPKNTIDPDAPKEEDFETYGDYLRADARYAVKQELAAGQKQTQETQSNQQETAWVEERREHTQTQASELIKVYPEARDILMESVDILESLPPYLDRAFLECDNAAIAFVNLAREGKLEELANMTPAKAIMEIAKAEAKGIPARTKSNAPVPMTAAKGTGVGGKSLDTMSADELVKWVNTK